MTDSDSEFLLAATRRGDLVYNSIRDLLVGGDVPPGERLDEEAIAAALGVSRTPIRESLPRLEAEGFVTRRPYRGAVARNVDGRWVEEVTALRVELEGLAARLSATRLQKSVLAEMGGLLEQQAGLEDSDVDHAAFDKLNRRFHGLIHGATGSLQLVSILATLSYHADRIRLYYHFRRHPRVLAHHRAILEGCLAADGAAAEQAMRQHVLGVFEVMAGTDVALSFHDLQILPLVLSEEENQWLRHALRNSMGR